MHRPRRSWRPDRGGSAADPVQKSRLPSIARAAASMRVRRSSAAASQSSAVRAARRGATTRPARRSACSPAGEAVGAAAVGPLECVCCHSRGNRPPAHVGDDVGELRRDEVWRRHAAHGRAGQRFGSQCGPTISSIASAASVTWSATARNASRSTSVFPPCLMLADQRAAALMLSTGAESRLRRRGWCAAIRNHPVSSMRCSDESWASRPNSV